MATQIVPAPVSADHQGVTLAEQVVGFRIMRQTEVAPGWWGTAREVGDTSSATVADSFCTEQNAVTMDPNRAKRIMYFAEPIYADGPAADVPPTYPGVSFADAVADCPVHRAQHEVAEARYAEFLAENGASMARRDRVQLGLRIASTQAVTA